MSGDHGHDEKVCQVFHRAIETIGRRWTGAILYTLCQRPHRFGEIREAIPDISDRLLTERLKELEEVGILVREVLPGRPAQVLYRLTPKGEALQPIIESIKSWANQWQGSPEEPAESQRA